MSIEAMTLVLHHSTASATDKLVLLGIANHEGDGGAFPSVATLAKYANVDSRTVQRSIAKLMKAGELEVDYQRGGTDATRGDRRPNRYRVLVRCPQGCSRGPNHGVTSESPRNGNGVTSEVNGVTPVSQGGDAGVANGVTWASPEPSIEPSLNRPRTVRATPAPASFQAWYDSYPRRIGKQAALTAYRRACKLTSEEELLLALKRQLPDLISRDPKYIPHPATWLNQQRWADEPPRKKHWSDEIAESLA